MSTQRYISTSFWDDKWIRSLDPSERYLYMYLLTNTLTTISGIYRITIDRMAYDTGYDERTLAPMLARFLKAGKAAHFEGEYMILPSWPKHQKWDTKETIKKGIDSDLKTIPNKVKIYAASIGYQYPIPTVPVGPELLYSDTDTDTDLDSDGDNEEPLPSEALALSELLYTLHVEKIDKGKKRPTDRILKNWAEDIDKLNRLDGRPWDDIEKVIRWVKVPGQFWAANIQSGSKLREKFDTLYAQMIDRGRGESKAQKVNERTAFLDMEEK